MCNDISHLTRHRTIRIDFSSHEDPGGGKIGLMESGRAKQLCNLLTNIVNEMRAPIVVSYIDNRVEVSFEPNSGLAQLLVNELRHRAFGIDDLCNDKVLHVYTHVEHSVDDLETFGDAFAIIVSQKCLMK